MVRYPPRQAAASLGAGNLTIFRRIVFLNLAPGIAAGVALAFARALGEFGTVILISGNVSYKTEVSSASTVSPDPAAEFSWLFLRVLHV